MEILKISEPFLDRLEELLESPSASLEWNNDFCRYLSHVRYMISALAEAWQEYPELKLSLIHI